MTAVWLIIIFGLLGWIFHLSRKIARARWQVKNREWERETVFNFLNEIGSHFTSRLDLRETLELVVEFSIKATRADAGGIFTVSSEDRNVLAPRVIQGMFPPLHEVATDKLASRRKFLVDFAKKERLRVGEGVIGLVAESGEALLIPNAREDPRVPKSASDLVELDGLILAPLVVQGEVDGVIVVMNKRDPNAPGATFDVADLNLLTALADQAAVTLHMVRLYQELTKRQRIEQELRVAHEFQALLLPREMPDLPEIAVHGTSDPALEVGGDYFDFIHVDDDHLGIVVGDVSGKGIPGALVMATLRSALRAEARGELSPKAVLQRVNSLVTRDTKEGIFVSVTYGILDRRTGKFRYARAGHEPLICCHEREARLTTHEPPGMVLGMLEGEVFDLLEEQEEDISKCGTAVLYTDGVPEAMNADAEEYGVERFHEVLVKNAGKDPEEISARVLEDIRQFSEGIPQHDDITLVVLRWRGQGGESNPGPGPSPDAQG